MAGPGTIISQIQAAPAQAQSMPQVTHNTAQIQQIQQGGQTITLTTSAPQQLQLAPTVVQPKAEMQTETNSENMQQHSMEIQKEEGKINVTFKILF